MPRNFITKSQAEKCGWKTDSYSLSDVAPGCSIGGDRFQDREDQLPDKKGRHWTECDIDYDGGSHRGAKRIVFSSDGLVYYTGDHYESFELLYGEGI
ncbi:MAG: ribonuclease domain-containing protein [Oscillospiraceae bacterium]